jgi:hypothetical protein
MQSTSTDVAFQARNTALARNTAWTSQACSTIDTGVATLT